MTQILNFIMNFLVSFEAWILRESLPTFITFIRFFSRMDFQIFNKSRVMPEGLLIFLTVIVFFFSMNSPMFNKGWALHEGSPTIIILIGFIPTEFSDVQQRINCTSKIFHIYHSDSFSPVCILWWLLSLGIFLKDFPYSLHGYGFSPVCILRCSKTAELSLKVFTHSLHLRLLSTMYLHMTSKAWILSKGFPTIFIFVEFLTNIMKSSWLKRTELFLEAIPHSLHLYGFSLKWIFWWLTNVVWFLRNCPQLTHL